MKISLFWRLKLDPSTDLHENIRINVVNLLHERNIMQPPPLDLPELRHYYIKKLARYEPRLSNIQVDVKHAELETVSITVRGIFVEADRECELVLEEMVANG